MSLRPIILVFLGVRCDGAIVAVFWYGRYLEK